MAVYFIRVGQYVKVGYSGNPERRCRRLFSSTTSYSAPWDAPRSLADRTLIGYVPGSKSDEWVAHEALEDFLAGCEFFLAERPVLDYAAKCLRRNAVVTAKVARPEGPAEFVGQVPLLASLPDSPQAETPSSRPASRTGLHITDTKGLTMSTNPATPYVGKHRPFYDRCPYTEWTDLIVTGQDRDNVARLLGYDYDRRSGALVAEFRQVVAA